MATTTPKAFFRGAATTTTTTTLYTVPSNTTAIITEVLAVNTSASVASFTISLDGVAAAQTVSVAAYDSTRVPLRQVLNATKVLSGGASSTAINLHICGVEIS